MIDEKEKRYIYIAFALIALILIIVIVSIWMPMFKNDEEIAVISSAKSYSREEYENKNLEFYKNLALQYIDKDNYDLYKDKIDKSYLEKYGLTQDNAKDYLISNKILGHPTSTTVIYNSKIKTDNKKYVYTYTYKFGNEEKKIHFIEEYYELYTISFDQESYPVISEGYEVEYENLKFKFEAENSYENTLVLNMSIENNSTEEYTFNLDSNTKASLIIADGTSKDLDSVIVGNETSKIISIPGSVMNTKLAFNVDVENQATIKNILLNDVVKSNGNSIVINLDLN